MYILILVQESQEDIKRLNYSQHKANIFRAAQHETMGGLCVLSLLSIALSSHLSLPPRGLVFCRWAWRLAPSSYSLQQNQYLRTIFTALLPGGWDLTLQLHLQFHPHIKTYQGQIQMPVSCHHYLTRKSAKCTVQYLPLLAIQAGQPHSLADIPSSAFANSWEGRRMNSLRGLKVSWRDFILPYSSLMRCNITCKFCRYKCN